MVQDGMHTRTKLAENVSVRNVTVLVGTHIRIRHARR